MTNQIHKRGRYSAAFKEQVATEALTSSKTIAQIASDHGISPEVVKDWKKQARELLRAGFRRGGGKSELARKDAEIAALQRLLGQRDMELDWLSKKSRELGL